ncbi:C6 transcription factor [Histoplasma capsulatum var. duboisii H88]|uniref:C6 transcription factor n=1 Tax=Ajellomyces capsulatus (strain H88) TaxID=544711 RepID=F0U9Y2_AJEC8|nr:C6 transcription factor [Histoplasma capsulatum var. duboisii H88]
MTNAEDAEDEDDIYLNVAEAGHKMMSSSLFSPRHLSWVILEKCLPAETCRDAFERMSKATVQMCLSTTGFGSDAALLGATRLKAAGEPISPNIAIEMVQTYEEHSSHPCLCEHSSRENNIVSYNLPIPVLAATYHSTLYSRTIPIPCNSESSSPIQPRKSTMTMQIFDTATAGPTPALPPASPAARIFLLKQNTTPAASPQNEHRPFSVLALAQR